MLLTDKDKARFWAKVDKKQPDECWLWVASLDHRGYGQFSIGTRKTQKIVKSHRVAWLLGGGFSHYENGSHEFVIRHTCDTPRCCNPAHLIRGTQDEKLPGRTRP